MTVNGKYAHKYDQEKATVFGKMDKHMKAIGKMTNPKDKAG